MNRMPELPKPTRPEVPEKPKTRPPSVSAKMKCVRCRDAYRVESKPRSWVLNLKTKEKSVKRIVPEGGRTLQTAERYVVWYTCKKCRKLLKESKKPEV